MQIISPQQFKVLPWKNGKGSTTELAISPQGTLDQFDWRLSIATVSEDGPFSNFAGIERNLILIEGEGIELVHDNIKTDTLNECLDFATFDGGCSTMGRLKNGTIKDFNVMHNPAVYTAEVITLKQRQSLKLKLRDHCFIAALESDGEIELVSKSTADKTINIKPKHLVILSKHDADECIVSGKQIIIIQLTLNE
jgi:uncharacterized protein